MVDKLKDAWLDELDDAKVPSVLLTVRSAEAVSLVLVKVNEQLVPTELSPVLVHGVVVAIISSTPVTL